MKRPPAMGLKVCETFFGRRRVIIRKESSRSIDRGQKEDGKVAGPSRDRTLEGTRKREKRSNLGSKKPVSTTIRKD